MDESGIRTGHGIVPSVELIRRLPHRRPRPKRPDDIIDGQGQDPSHDHGPTHREPAIRM